MEFLKKYFPIISISLFVLLIGLFIFKMFYSKSEFVASAINNDITAIALSLEKIDRECSILSFEHNKNFVDFLNVKAFSGSRVGSMNLAYSDKWDGPYLKSNPTIKSKFYVIVKAEDGLFVVPGNGVKLPNKLVIGKDFEITEKSLVGKMIQEGGKLFFKGKQLGKQLKFKVGDWPRPEKEENKRLEEISKTLKEFNDSMPFTKNEDQDLRA
jgi:hypothetical protein